MFDSYYVFLTLDGVPHNYSINIRPFTKLWNQSNNNYNRKLSIWKLFLVEKVTLEKFLILLLTWLKNKLLLENTNNHFPRRKKHIGTETENKFFVMLRKVPLFTAETSAFGRIKLVHLPYLYQIKKTSHWEKASYSHC